MGRSIGRAMRTVLAFVPAGVTNVKITYTKLDQPLTTYEFFDLPKLQDYLAGKIDRQTFNEAVLVRYPNQDDVIPGVQKSWFAALVDSPSDRASIAPAAEVREEQLRQSTGGSAPAAVAGPTSVAPTLVAISSVTATAAANQPARLESDGKISVALGHEGDVVQVTSEDRENNRFKIAPKLGFFFNDPSGAFRYSLSAAANYDRRLNDGLYLNAAATLSILETVSGVKQPSNSTLPHVRTDIAKYLGERRFALSRVLLNKYASPAERWYVRGSAGLYEDMYRGVGGQVLYLPKDSRWAADVSVDAQIGRAHV